MKVFDGITLYGSGSYQGTIIEVSENHVFVKSCYGDILTFNKKDVQETHTTIWNGTVNPYGANPQNSLEWQHYYKISKK